MFIGEEIKYSTKWLKVYKNKVKFLCIMVNEERMFALFEVDYLA
nr:MAG TPA: hypothetical protein [Caudoviricetes sp.]